MPAASSSLIAQMLRFTLLVVAANPLVTLNAISRRITFSVVEDELDNQTNGRAIDLVPLSLVTSDALLGGGILTQQVSIGREAGQCYFSERLL